MTTRRHLLAVAVFGTAMGAPAMGSAAPIEFVEQRDTYMIFDDDGTVEFANWFERDPFLYAYGEVETGFLGVHPDDSQFIIIYTTWDLFGAGALYQSVANDVEGIGYEHIAASDPVIPAPIFDDTPGSQVFGFMHMNNWQNYLGNDPGDVNDTRISLIFGQELGHAWLAFPYFDQGGGALDTMIGRQQAHWSFYLHSGGSPIEGHQWMDNANGTFTAQKLDMYQYSDLDLYLMGLMPASDVQPWFVLENPTNCIDSAKDPPECAPPGAFQFQADSYQVTADRTDITIADVIAAEGPRVPDFANSPKEFDISFLLIKRPGEELTEAEKALMDNIVNRSIEIWVAQTRDFGSLVNRTAKGGGGTGTTGGSTSGTTATASTSNSGGSSSGSGATSSTATGSTSGSGGTDSDGGTDTGGNAIGDRGCSCRGGDRPAAPIAILGGLVFARRARRRRAS